MHACDGGEPSGSLYPSMAAHTLGQLFSVFLILRPFDTVLYVAVTLNSKFIFAATS